MDSPARPCGSFLRWPRRSGRTQWKSIDQLPDLEAILRIEVLDPRGSVFPRSDDLALRA